MTTNNGWPGEPGVPINPERDGWHWVKTEHSLAPWRWKENPESIMWEFGWEAGDGVISPAYFAALGPCTYLGPALSHDEATALQARIAELEAENAGLSANQCLHDIHGDESGNMYCPRIAELEAALHRIADTDPDDGTAWFHEVAHAALEGGK